MLGGWGVVGYNPIMVSEVGERSGGRLSPNNQPPTYVPWRIPTHF